METGRSFMPVPGRLDRNFSEMPSSGWMRRISRLGAVVVSSPLKMASGAGLKGEGILGERLGSAVPGAQIERHAGPAPVVHKESYGRVGVGLRVGLHAGFLAESGNILAADVRGAILT